jgi:alkanesulfonate monooxygenase SsuD/methylene tetrahydromethanopterin reductase-like flavin-dependent oxidoreductase (luciferase family)
MHPLRFGLKLSQAATLDTLTAIWRIADDSGFDHRWNMDHFATPPSGPRIRLNPTPRASPAAQLLCAQAHPRRGWATPITVIHLGGMAPKAIRRPV